MGGFLGLGNSSAKTDRGNQLGGINAEWNVFNRGLPLGDTQAKAGQATQQSGLSGLENVKKYWQTLIGGNRPAVMQAAAPAVNAVNEQADAAKTQQAEMGTSRGGGAASGNQQIETEKQKQLNDIIAKIQPVAAQGLEGVSTTESQVGDQQLKEALASLGLSQDSAHEIVESSIKSRPISMKANAEVRQQWSDFLAAMGL